MLVILKLLRSVPNSFLNAATLQLSAAQATAILTMKTVLVIHQHIVVKATTGVMITTMSALIATHSQNAASVMTGKLILIALHANQPQLAAHQMTTNQTSGVHAIPKNNAAMADIMQTRTLPTRRIARVQKRPNAVQVINGSLTRTVIATALMTAAQMTPLKPTHYTANAILFKNAVLRMTGEIIQTFAFATQTRNAVLTILIEPIQFIVLMSAILT